MKKLCYQRRRLDWSLLFILVAIIHFLHFLWAGLLDLNFNEFIFLATVNAVQWWFCCLMCDEGLGPKGIGMEDCRGCWPLMIETGSTGTVFNSNISDQPSTCTNKNLRYNYLWIIGNFSWSGCCAWEQNKRLHHLLLRNLQIFKVVWFKIVAQIYNSLASSSWTPVPLPKLLYAISPMWLPS